MRRQAFADELRRNMAVHPVTAEIAEVAGRIEGEQATRGVSIAFEDLLIWSYRPLARLPSGDCECSALPGHSGPFRCSLLTGPVTHRLQVPFLHEALSLLKRLK
jgi:hypothetical protein